MATTRTKTKEADAALAEADALLAEARAPLTVSELQQYLGPRARASHKHLVGGNPRFGGYWVDILYPDGSVDMTLREVCRLPRPVDMPMGDAPHCERIIGNSPEALTRVMTDFHDLELPPGMTVADIIGPDDATVWLTPSFFYALYGGVLENVREQR